MSSDDKTHIMLCIAQGECHKFDRHNIQLEIGMEYIDSYAKHYIKSAYIEINFVLLHEN